MPPPFHLPPYSACPMPAPRGTSWPHPSHCTVRGQQYPTTTSAHILFCLPAHVSFPGDECPVQARYLPSRAGGKRKLLGAKDCSLLKHVLKTCTSHVQICGALQATCQLVGRSTLMMMVTPTTPTAPAHLGSALRPQSQGYVITNTNTNTM